MSDALNNYLKCNCRISRGFENDSRQGNSKSHLNRIEDQTYFNDQLDFLRLVAVNQWITQQDWNTNTLNLIN